MISNKNQVDFQFSLDSNVQIHVDSVDNEAFSKIDFMYIAQRFDVHTQTDDCSNENCYLLYQINTIDAVFDQKKTRPFIKINAQSGCCERYTLPSSCRSFIMEGKLNMTPSNQKLLFTLQREYQLSCLFYNRPFLSVKSQNGEIIGYATQPFFSLQKTINIYDQIHQLQFQIKGVWNQYQTYCLLPCKQCKIITFELFNKFNKKVGEIKKFNQKKGFCHDSILNAESEYAIQFPKLAQYEEKILILAGIFFLDYNFYEEKYFDMFCLGIQKCCCASCIE